MLVHRQTFFLGGVENLFRQKQRINTGIQKGSIEYCGGWHTGYEHLRLGILAATQLKTVVFNFGMDSVGNFVNLFYCIVCKFVWIFCIAQEDTCFKLCAGSQQHWCHRSRSWIMELARKTLNLLLLLLYT